MKLDWIEGHGVAEILALLVVVALQNARRIVDLPAIEADIFFSLSLCVSFPNPKTSAKPPSQTHSDGYWAKFQLLLRIGLVGSTRIIFVPTIFCGL